MQHPYPSPFSMPSVLNLPAQDLWIPIFDGVLVIFDSSLHPILLPQPCSVTWAQYFRAAPHIQTLLVYGVYLPFSLQLVQNACGLVKSNTSSCGNQLNSKFDTFLSNGLLQAPYNFSRICFVNILANMSSCVGNIYSVCFSQEGISVPPNGNQKQWKCRRVLSHQPQIAWWKNPK